MASNFTLFQANFSGSKIGILLVCAFARCLCFRTVVGLSPEVCFRTAI
jgi:hypothetical protein